MNGREALSRHRPAPLGARVPRRDSASSTVRPAQRAPQALPWRAPSACSIGRMRSLPSRSRPQAARWRPSMRPSWRFVRPAASPRSVRSLRRRACRQRAGCSRARQANAGRAQPVARSRMPMVRLATSLSNRPAVVDRELASVTDNPAVSGTPGRSRSFHPRRMPSPRPLRRLPTAWRWRSHRFLP